MGLRGQADQRLVHQLYLGDAALAMLVFDGQRDDTVVRLVGLEPRAARRRTRHAEAPRRRRESTATRCASARDQLDGLRERGGGSATTTRRAPRGRRLPRASRRDHRGDRLDADPVAVVARDLPAPATGDPRLKDSGRALTSTKELRDWLPAQIGPFEPAELDAVIALLAGPGAVLPLGFGDYVLLRPELINAYAQAVISSLRDDPLERGCIAEERVLRGELDYAPDFARLPEADERVVLHAMHKQLVERAICLRDIDPRQRPTMLVFPSYFRRERPERPGRPAAFMTCGFDGYLDEIYARLVVRLHHTRAVRQRRAVAQRRRPHDRDHKTIGIRLDCPRRRQRRARAALRHGTPISDQVLSTSYVDDHSAAAPRTSTPADLHLPAVRDPGREPRRGPQTPARRQTRHRLQHCEARITLWDEIEQPPRRSTAAHHRRQDAARQPRAAHNESRERLLVGEVHAMAARANQIAREHNVSDHGIDMEIEFETTTTSQPAASLPATQVR